MDKRSIQIENNPSISAIYFALLQTGYNFYKQNKSIEVIDKLSCLQVTRTDFSFFNSTNKSTCEVYPYWPRASMLEAASFYVDINSNAFSNFNELKAKIMTANNIADNERNADFWNWIKEFPTALTQVLSDDSFQSYLKWEDDWIEQQKSIYFERLSNVQTILETCNKLYNSPVKTISILLNPIKCSYSADYHMYGNCFFFCSGEFDEEGIVHEFMHHIAHRIIVSHRDEILQNKINALELDKSYYLSNDEDGYINAFEEYYVRLLTDEIILRSPPENLSVYLSKILSALC